MKNLVILASLFLSFSSFASVEKCTPAVFEGSYTSHLSVFAGDLKYSEDISADKLDRAFTDSLMQFSLQADKSGSLKYKSKGLTSSGAALIKLFEDVEGTEIKKELLEREKLLESLVFTPKFEDGVCMLDSELGMLGVMNSSYTRFFALDEDEKGKTIISELFKKNVDVLEEDPFAL